MADEVNVTIEAIASAVDSLPAGWIRIFLGDPSEIPLGWLLCDGTNGTPDLRDVFIKGAPAGLPSGGVGGALSHLHSLDLYSSLEGCHGHNVGGDTTFDGTYHSHELYGEAPYGEHYHYVCGWAYPCYYDYIAVDYGCGPDYASCCWHGHEVWGDADYGGHSHPLYGFTSEEAGYHSHEIAGYTTYDGDHCHRLMGSVCLAGNLPPYYEVLFIMKA